MPSLNASSLLLFAGLVVAIYCVLRRRLATGTEPKRRPLAALRLPATLRLPDPGQQPDHERPLEMLRWETEMHDTGRRLKAELDSKLAALQALCILAGRESERLEAAIRRAESLSVPVRSDSLAVLERLGDPAALGDPTALATAADLVAKDGPPSPPDPFAGEDTELKIANLAAGGLSAEEIAHRLKTPLGEVEFRLNLIAR